MRSGLRRLKNATNAPVPFAAPGRYSVLSLYGGQSDNEAYMRTFGTNGTIHSIVTLLAGSVGSTNWRLYRNATDGRQRYTTADRGSDQRVEITAKHAALSLWQRPNDFMTTSEFVEGFQQHLELTGEAYWVLSYAQGVKFPTAMWYVRPDRMQPVPSTTGYLAGWIYKGEDGQEIPLNLNEVIQLKYPNPLNPYRGLGPAQTVLTDIQGMNYASEYNRNYFLNSAEPGGLIQVDKRLSDSEWDELTNRWRESHQGMSRAHRVGVLESGAQWVGTVSSMKDMDFAKLIDASRDKIREAWGLHKAMLGNSDDVNRANAQTAEEVFGSWQVMPRLNRIKCALNERLLPLFGVTGEGVEFDYDNPLPDDREADNSELQAKATAAKMLIDAGYDPHDVLEVVGLPDMGVVEKATQAPAAPPGWVPEPPAQPGQPAQPNQEGEQPKKPGSLKKADQELSNLMLQRLILNRTENR